MSNDTYVGNTGLLEDNEVDEPKENQPLNLWTRFGGITDIQVGPDGYLYILDYTGSIYRKYCLYLIALNQSLNQAHLQAPLHKMVVKDSKSVSAVILGIDGDNSYSPEPIEIESGQTVTWINGDTIFHTVTSGQDGDLDEGTLFDSDAIIPNQSYSLTFDSPGEFDYYCIYHPTMVGEVIVNGPDTSSPTSEDSPDEESDEED